jgi:hypothetical protein
MLVKVLVGSSTSKIFHVFELDAVLPRLRCTPASTTPADPTRRAAA